MITVHGNGATPLDRLWKSTSLSGTPLFTYTYDANGNRTQQVAPGGTTNYAYATGTDRIAQATGAAARHYAHDAFGSRIWAGPSAYAGTPSHVYDEGSRLVEVRDPTTQAVLGQYAYDAAGRRVRKVAGGTTTLYFYDVAGHLIESQNLSTSPATRRSYVFVEDEPMGVVDQPASGSPVVSWIHTDRLGTPLAVTSTPGAGPAKAIWRASYEPFGLATADEDPDGDSTNFGLDLRFPGQVFDAESGGHDNYFRTYDPTVGRYLEADPIGQLGGINVYEYADDNPANEVDPYGLYSSLQATLDVANFLTGVADAASLGLGPLARDALAGYGWGGHVDPCSTAYSAGGWASLGLGVGRLGYAAAAKGVSRFASSGLAASAGRNTLKRIFRGGLFPNYRAYSPSSLLGTYGSDAALRAAAGRTDSFWNAVGANLALGSAANCGCDRASGSGNGGQGGSGGNGGNDLAGQFLGGLGALNRR